MKTTYIPKIPLHLHKIVIMDDEQSPEWMSYIIELHTIDGIIKIKGDHDSGPDLEDTNLLYE